MIDPNFDPYDELLLARHNIAELIKAMNHYSELLKELSNQHNILIAHNKETQRKIQLLEFELNRLKLSQF